MKMEALRVLDLSQDLPGPWLTQVPADHGAEVIKIELRSGELVRAPTPMKSFFTKWSTPPAT